jgi:hypothetical protein
MSLSPRIRYVPDWSGSMRQVAVFPGPSPRQNFKLAAWIRDPYGVWPASPVSGLPYRGYMGPNGPPSLYAPYTPVGYAAGGLYPGGIYPPLGLYPGGIYPPVGLYPGGGRLIPPQVSPWACGNTPIRQGSSGFTCGSGSCGYKSYGSRLATQSDRGVPLAPSPVQPSLIEADLEDIPVASLEDEWPLSL